jgi:hypothetical protein
MNGHRAACVLVRDLHGFTISRVPRSRGLHHHLRKLGSVWRARFPLCRVTGDMEYRKVGYLCTVGGQRKC